MKIKHHMISKIIPYQITLILYFLSPLCLHLTRAHLTTKERKKVRFLLSLPAPISSPRSKKRKPNWENLRLSLPSPSQHLLPP